MLLRRPEFTAAGNQDLMSLLVMGQAVLVA